MIDTNAFKFSLAIPPELLLQGWKECTERYADGGVYHCFTLTRILENGAPVLYAFFPHSYTGGPLVNVQFSLPHVIHGNNLELLLPLEQAINAANIAINAPDQYHLPEINLWEGTLTRLDGFYNHQVGNLVDYYIYAIRDLEYSRRKTKPYQESGVMFVSNSATTKFYDKEKESKNPAAHGFLRQETTLRSKAIKKLTGKKKNPMIGDITPELLYSVLDDNLDKLGLNRSIADYDTALPYLCAQYGSFSGVFLFGFLHAKKAHPNKKLIIEATNYRQRSVQRFIRKILDAGLAATFSISPQPLPPLTIDRSRWPKGHSDVVSESTK